MEVIKTFKKKENAIVELIKLNKSEYYVIKYYKNFSRSMLLEINILATNRHKNIIPVERIAIIDDLYPTIIMPVVKCNMCDLFYNPAYNARDKLNILLQISYGLSYLHDNNIVHCDIKPENIMIENENAYIIDFGSAEYIQDGYTKTKYIKCTATHRPPEGFDLLDDGFFYITHKFDIWSFGITILEIFCGMEMHRLPVAPKYIPDEDPNYISKYDAKMYNFFKSIIFKNYYKNKLPEIFWKCLAKKSSKRPNISDLSLCLKKFMADGMIGGRDENVISANHKDIIITNNDDNIFSEYNKILEIISNNSKYCRRYPAFIIDATRHLITKLNSLMENLPLEYIHHAIFLCNKFNSIEKMIPIEKIIPNFRMDNEIVMDIILKTKGIIFE